MQGKFFKTSLFIIFLSLNANTALSEYRVYQYYVRSKTQNINPSSANIVTSTLNPISYAAYNGGNLSIEVNLLRSWLCYGDTSKREVCTISEGLELSSGVVE